ncbi:MAG: PilZ domain-containing protein [Sphingomonadaceae bacterium]
MSALRNPATGPEGLGGPPPGQPEKRAAMRLTLLIRTAKLVNTHGEFLCIIRDVSDAGVKLRLFHPLPLAGGALLELANGDRYAIENVWQRGSEAGFRFDKRIDLRAFIAESGRHPKRALRLRLTCPGAIVCDGEVHEAIIRDISRQGMRIETATPLALDQRVIVHAPGLPDIDAVVRWRNRPDFGLALRHIFSFRDLAISVARLQLPGTVPSDLPEGPAGQRRG